MEQERNFSITNKTLSDFKINFFPTITTDLYFYM